MTQVPYDDIRQIVNAGDSACLTGTPMIPLHKDTVKALLADARRWRMIEEGGDAVVEVVARAMNPETFKHAETNLGGYVETEIAWSRNAARAALLALRNLTTDTPTGEM